MSQSIDENVSNGEDAVSMSERSAETIGKGVESAKKSVAAAQETAAQTVEQAGDELHKLAQTGTRFVRENPGAAIAGAVGVGILVGLALRGRD